MPSPLAYAADLLDPPQRVYPTPGDLARALDPTTVQTPALRYIDAALVEAAQTRDARLIISLPPQEGKSQRVTQTGTLWRLIQDPDLRCGVVSYAQLLAEGFGRTIRNWITANSGQDGGLDLGLRVARDNGSVRRWGLAGRRGGVVCAGIGSGLTGKPLDYLVIDDPVADAEQAASPTYRDRVWEHWRSVASTRLAPGAPVIVILTRWHEDDLAGRLLAAPDGAVWRVINIPAQAEAADPLGRPPGEYLTSARRRTPAEWDAIKIRAGSRAWSALYQGRPTTEGGEILRREWWRRYDHADTTGMRVISSWDTAVKDTGDYVAGLVLGLLDGQVYVLDAVHARLSFSATVDALLGQLAAWPMIREVLIEDTANGPAIIDVLRRRVPHLIPVPPAGSKVARAQAIAPAVEAGSVLLPSPRVARFDVEGLIEEASAFPNGAHDDRVDALSQGVRRLLYGQTSTAWLEHHRRAVAEGHLPEVRTDWAALMNQIRGERCGSR